MNILLVDDEPSNLRLLQMLLESEDHVTACAANGQEALAMAQANPPDLIISDILMPVMDGYTLCQAWLKEPSLRKIPFIFYTATYTSDEDEAFGLSLGAAAFMHKPMEPQAFLDQIERVVRDVKSGVIKPAKTSAMGDEPFLKLYNERLIHKLDQRSVHLSQQLGALQQSEASLRLKSAALEAASNAIVITDRAGTILWGNPALATLTGYSLDELVGQDLRLLKSGRHDDAFYARIWEEILAGRTWQGELVNQRKNGTLYTEEMTITPILDEQGEITHFTAIKWDITETKRIEAELRQSHKMEAVGRLAGGLAHDFNNMLNIILLSTEISLLDEELPERHRKHLLEIQQAGQRSSDLTRQLLAFSRNQSACPRALDLNLLIAEDHKMMQRLLGEDVNLTFAPGDDLWSVLMDPSQVSQILANLVINARDAMPKGGIIVVETSNLQIEEASAFRHDQLPPGDFVLLSVSDTGFGMDATTLEHAFEPFFTTKAEGKGTGLGLATVYGIVKQNHGAVYACSHPGVGTTMKIYLPRISGDPTAEPPRAEGAAPKGTEIILVAEDETAVLEVVQRTLENQGYGVLVASSPQDACSLAERHEGPIHLLLADVVMPGMNGKELQEWILTRRPSIRTLFMSGYTGDIIATRGLMEEGTHFIQKPFRISDLANKVREVLDA